MTHEAWANSRFFSASCTITDNGDCDGKFLVKVFQGEGYEEYRKALLQSFTVIKSRKPEASRARSREVYLLATGFKAK